MTIHEQIKKDLQIARKEKCEIIRNALTVVLGELARIDTKNWIDDQRVINLLKKMINDVKSLPEESYDLGFVSAIEIYIPKEMGVLEIIDWIDNNVDFSTLKNKMQAVGIVKKGLGTKADGKLISQIIKEQY